MAVKTRFLIISDTHGRTFDLKKAQQANPDVVIHCGDLTDESKIDEFRTTINLLSQLPAPLNLVISGNHDLTLDEPTFQQRLAEATQPIEPELVTKNFGSPGEPRQLFEQAKEDAGIVLLDEGNRTFELSNGAALHVYASPFTASRGGWAFQYPPEDKHDFDIAGNTQVVITHGPPHGIMDYTDSKQRAGCPQLFAAVARAKPLVHCFGHIHEAWGGKLVSWRNSAPVSENLSHFTHIDNERSVVIEKLSNITTGGFDDADMVKLKAEKAQAYASQGYCSTSHCSHDTNPLIPGSQTLFVNASIEGKNDEVPMQPPWIVDIELPESVGQDYGT
ncbi:hypothetical protein PG999_012259 [Apiospora kogelbergensis]|uniref:Calcineurin-like phosphoesterase domain-containing protein n=1 Tax=Apiospora kogelbergensis TaxID=1337665 RepID=A0AAW0QGV7_9PEZI